MDVCIVGRYHSSSARPYGARDHAMQISYTPLVSRRPSTSYVGRQAFSPSPRIQSAQTRVAMTTPRSQVSMAGFYDWSTEEFEDHNATSVYQKIAISHKHKLNKGNKNWCTDGVHLNPGRMFVRDKADLTKGEREIIAGIYKNRGDMASGGGKNGYVAHARSHKDAWLVGKQFPRKGASFIDCDKGAIKVPENLFSKAEVQFQNNSPREQSDCGNYMCDKCKDYCIGSGHCLKGKPIEKGPVTRKGQMAPPSSPDQSPKSSRKQLKQPSSNEGAVFIESEKTFYEAGARKKKVYVDVFLPKFPAPGLSDEATNLNLEEKEHEIVKAKVNDPDKLFKISEQYTEHSDEGYSSQEKSPHDKHWRSNRSQRSRSSGKPDSCCGD